ncbi:hypothetical protein BGX24_011265 [Mortierella sp. AD032]|nr:hypothetical protein BGX24_011265 [Mortierella sp. AD032]
MSSQNTAPSSNSDGNSSQAVPYRSSRWPARLMILTGVIHNVAGLFDPHIGTYFNEALKAGYVNQFTGSFTRSHAFWFYLVGVNFIMAGRLMDWYLFPEDVREQQKDTKQSLVRSQRVLPREVGYWFLGIGVAGVAAFPESGFYMLIFQGAGLILAQ